MQTYQIPGPLKLIDGIFMGNSLAANDIDWLSLNQVTHIINCAGLDLPLREYEKQGIQYLVFDWHQAQIQPMLFGIGDSVLNMFIDFVEKGKVGGGSILIHGKESESRTCCLVVGYLMKHFGWNIFKTLEFINSRNRDLELEPKFFQQLNSLHKRLSDSGIIKPFGWQTKQFKNHAEKVITNTYINSQMITNAMKEEDKQKIMTGRLSSKTLMKSSKKVKKRIEWKDTTTQNIASHRLVSELKYNQNQRIAAKEHVPKMVQIKSVLKGFKNSEEIQTQNRVDKERETKMTRSITKLPEKERSRQKQKDREREKQNQSVYNDLNNESSSKLNYTKRCNIINSNDKQNDSLEYIQNQIVKEQGQFGRLRGKRTKQPDVLGWTRMDLKNIKTFDQEMKRKEIMNMTSYGQYGPTKPTNAATPIIIMKPNMNVSILQPHLKRSKSEKKQEQSKQLPGPQQQSSTNIIDNNYLKILRNRMNQTIQEPQILSMPTYKREGLRGEFGTSTTGGGMKRERSSSAKMVKDRDCKENDLFSMNSFSQNQMPTKPKWK